MPISAFPNLQHCAWLCTFCSINFQIGKVASTITSEDFTKYSCPPTQSTPPQEGNHTALKHFNKRENCSLLYNVFLWPGSPESFRQNSLLSLNYLSNCIIVCFTLVAQIFSSARRCGNWLVAREHKTHGSKASAYKKESV